MFCAQHGASLAVPRCHSCVKASPEADHARRPMGLGGGHPGPWLYAPRWGLPLVTASSTTEEQEPLTPGDVCRPKPNRNRGEEPQVQKTRDVSAEICPRPNPPTGFISESGRALKPTHLFPAPLPPPESTSPSRPTGHGDCLPTGLPAALLKAPTPPHGGEATLCPARRAAPALKKPPSLGE